MLPYIKGNTVSETLPASHNVKYNTKVLIDTNVVLECKNIKDLPWEEIDSSGPILILLLPTLLREVDSKKRDGRLGIRARDFNRLIAPLASKLDLITIREESPRVDIALANCSKIKWENYDDLDPNEGDARLVAEALHLKNHAKEELTLLSQDINPLILFRRQGLSTFHLPNSWLAKMEQSPQEKEFAKLKRQISDYAKTEPEFEVIASLPSEPSSIYIVERLDENEALAIKTKILEINPRPSQVKGQFHQVGLGLDFDHSLNSRYDTYKSKTVPDFVNDLHKKMELRHGQIPFKFVLKNIGKVRSENLHVEVRCVHGWLNGRVIMSGVYPRAPVAKSSLKIPDYSTFFRPSALAGRHDVEVDKISKSHFFTAQCAEFRQGQSWEFEGVLWLDPSVEQMTTVVWTVTASNFHGAFEHIVKVPKVVVKKKVLDLIEIDGKSKVHPHTFGLFKDAIDNEKYDSIEWDNMTDK
jgi:hypothetical protein